LGTVLPSAKREGFATVPDVSWADIGSLNEVRSELKWSILVGFNFIQFKKIIILI
jgi:ribosome biogenesis ATPase